MSKAVYIDEEECIGCGSCVEICSEVFQMKEQWQSRDQEGSTPDALK